jgi:hypothetical protein
MNPAVDGFVRSALVRRSALALVVLSLLAALLLGLAEQGGIGSALSPVPQQPLPFARERVFGLDLTDRPSLEAVQWMEASGTDRFALVYLPVDDDIIAALTSESARADAHRALDAMMAATVDTTVALCLERPVTQIDDPVLAELTIDTLRDRYPDRIAYVTTCSSSGEASWAQAIADQFRSSRPALPGNLVPLSSGADVNIEAVAGFEALSRENLRGFAGSIYVLPSVQIVRPLDAAQIDPALTAIRDAAQIGLVMLRPDAAVDPLELVRSIEGVALRSDQLPEGFTGVTSPALVFAENWEAANAGRVNYRRTQEPGAALRSTFIGTTIYLQALLTPGAGGVAVWIDPDPAGPAEPDATIDLSVTQARDAALVVAEGLAADRHTIVIVTTGGEVSVSGLFVSGQPEAGWNAGLAVLALLLIATLAMAIVGLARVQDIRDRTALPPSQTPHPAHPRAYTRDG